MDIPKIISLLFHMLESLPRSHGQVFMYILKVLWLLYIFTLILLIELFYVGVVTSQKHLQYTHVTPQES